MFRELLERVRAEASGERAHESVCALARFHRVQASPGYDEAAHWLCGALKSHGLEPEVETVPGDGHTRLLGQLMPEGWECTRALATLVDGPHRQRLCDYEAERLSLVLRSAPARGRFRLVAVEDGAEERDYEGLDVRGAVVLTRAPVHRAHRLAVVERGAAGLLHDGRRLLPPVRERMDDPDALTYASFWWSTPEPRGWGFVASPRQGERLRERLRGGDRLELDVEIEARAFATLIPLVSATLRGRREGEVLIVAHLCHPRPSANDNASGAAALLEAARVLATLRARGEFSDAGLGVRLLWVPEITGTYAWIASDPDRARRTVAALNLDMVGEDQERCGSTFLIERPPCFAASFAEDLIARIRAEAQDWVTTYSGPGHFSMTRMAEVPYSGGSDHAVLGDPAVGVPCPALIQWPDRFYHSSHDTPDKCDPRSLALAVRCAATYAAFLASLTDSGRAWLTDAVGRGARARLLSALDRAEPAREVARERIRMRRTLASLGRLGLDPPRLEAARGSLEAYAAREASLPAPQPPARPAAAKAGARPRRRQAAPLDYQRHLLAGYAGLTRADREGWWRLEKDAPEDAPLFDLAWFACDGRRTLDEIARLVWIECGHYEPDALAEFFTYTERLGLSDWSGEEEDAWSSSERDTATP
jgi:hypothetical protein